MWTCISLSVACLFIHDIDMALQIMPRPCWVNGVEGTCMFVYECIKTDGFHIGMCVDNFMFGSCCAHNVTENTILSQKHKPSVIYNLPSQNIQTTKKPVEEHRSTRVPQSSHSTKLQSSVSNQTHTLISLIRPSSSSRNPTPPSRHSERPSITDGFQLDDSNVIYTFTKPGWQSTTEPGFITSLHQNSMYSQFGSSAQWPQTTESNYITKTKFKPNNSKRKPTKKPTHNFHKITTKYGAKPTKVTSTTESPCIICNALVTGATLEKVSVKPDFVSTSTFTNLVPNGGTETIGCGIPQMTSLPQTRIVGGKSALFGRWPWQVSVRRTSFFGFSSTHRCGGAVLNENWIATAGHCVDDLLTSQIRIRVGEYDFSNAEEELPYVERAITKKVVHPKYNFFTYEYDLALVQLDKPLEYLPHIAPICLPASDDLLIGENATVTGWGRLNEGGTLPSILQEVQVPIVSNDRCKSMFLRAGRHEFIPDIFLCAGHETGGQDSCQGDSGGPLQVKGKDGRYFLAGIISWGIGCAEANLPGVCTRISKFVPWILKNVT